MSKFQDFFAKAAADEKVKQELITILAGKKLSEADDAQLEKICSVAKGLGFDLSVAEFKKTLQEMLSDGKLNDVAGGVTDVWGPDCYLAAGTIVIQW
jgi:hypothetical protein